VKNYFLEVSGVFEKGDITRYERNKIKKKKNKYLKGFFLIPKFKKAHGNIPPQKKSGNLNLNSKSSLH
jgi:hypothetical protein